MFGEILDSARTAVAEGQKETGTNTGDRTSNSRASSSQTAKTKSQAPTGADVIAAAAAFLTGQAAPAQKPSVASKSGSAGSAVPAAQKPGATPPSTPSVGTVTSAAAKTTVGDAAEPRAADVKADGAAGQKAAAAAGQAGTDKSGATQDDAHTSALATMPATVGSYKPTSATPSTATEAASQATAAQKADPDLQKTAKEAIDTKQPVASVPADVPKPATTQAQPQAATQSTTADHTQQQTGGGHTGNGSGGHPDTPGQSNTVAAPSTSSNGTGGSQAATAFSLEQAAAAKTGNTQAGSLSHGGIARSAVTLSEAADAVRATFTAANQAGISSARISLSPDSLGGIKISLSQTPEGLIARVATDHPEAAAALQQSAADLKRSLEDSGVSLLRLDIGSSGQQSLGSFSGSAGDGSQAGAGPAGGHTESPEAETTSTPTEMTVQLSSGSLVNVLA